MACGDLLRNYRALGPVDRPLGPDPETAEQALNMGRQAVATIAKPELAIIEHPAYPVPSRPSSS